MSGIALRMRQLREYNGLTQFDLAYRSGVKRGVIAKIEAGETAQPELKHTISLAKALHTTPIFLQFGVKEKDTLDGEIVSMAEYLRDFKVDRDTVALAVKINKLDWRKKREVMDLVG